MIKRLITKRKKLQTIGVVVSIVLLAYLTLVYPLDGIYSGQLLRSVSGGQTKLLLKNGSAYLKTPSHPLVPFGSYESRDGKIILSMGGTNLFLITRTFGGIKLKDYPNVHPDLEYDDKLWKVWIPIPILSSFKHTSLEK